MTAPSCAVRPVGLDVNMHFFGKRLRPANGAALFLAACFLSVAPAIRAADVDAARALFQKGDYAECLRLAQRAFNAAPDNDDWAILLARAQLATGHYPEAVKTVTAALTQYSPGIPLQLQAYEVFKANGLTNRSAKMLEDLNQHRTVRDAPSLVALGRAALLLNIEPRLVLENFFDQAQRIDPACRDAYLAAGELSLDKTDFKLAAQKFNAALVKFPDDPDIEFGLARAFAPSDPAQMGKYLETVLDYNTNHVPAMLLLVDYMVDAEEYAEADKMLARALTVNPWAPDAWAYRAVLADLRNDPSAAATNRATALKYWESNPRVDYLIGKKLAQKYRFMEGAAHQRQALKFDTDCIPAKIELAQDLLRLGSESEGWQLATAVNDEDGYDVTAYNLVDLHDTISKYRTLTNQDFILRMDAHEADLYGERALSLLQRAKDHLSEKYGMKLDQPTLVEIFREQKDFAVRTFGVAHNPGFLGVCFGHVITANSPAAQSGHPANWEAVLWHEFCHVITLNLTKNKMPRWLSEGISVYEERQANPVWGQSLTSRYRAMILGPDLTPVGDLSSAFMSPKSPLHMQFAYFESCLVVEYIVQQYGIDALKQILADLGQGVEINDALAHHTAPLEKLEKDFTAFAHDRAKNLAPGLDWKRPAGLTRDDDEADATPTPSALPPGVSSNLVRVLTLSGTNSGPVMVSPDQAAATTAEPAALATAAAATNYWVLVRDARQALSSKEWAEAKKPLQKLIELYPNQSGADSAYGMLAAVHRELNETNEERAVLAKLATIEPDTTDAFLRLMELDQAAGDWEGVATNAQRFLAVNPLVPEPYRYQARASEQLKQLDNGIRAFQCLLLLDPPDPADVQFRLARLLHQKGDEVGARRHVIQALEEAPRYRDAQRLLLEIEAANPSTTRASAQPVGR